MRFCNSYIKKQQITSKSSYLGTIKSYSTKLLKMYRIFIGI